MQVTKDKVVSIEYKLTNDSGEVLDTSEGREPLSYLHGSRNIIPGLEKAIEGKAVGEQFEVQVPAAEAYGERDDALVQAVPTDRFPEGSEPEVGQQFQAQTPQGARAVTVVNVEDEFVTVDANHPLAGQPLNFEVNVVEVREATPEELSHGHVHGPDGHQH